MEKRLAKKQDYNSTKIICVRVYVHFMAPICLIVIINTHVTLKTTMEFTKEQTWRIYDDTYALETIKEETIQRVTQQNLTLIYKHFKNVNVSRNVNECE